MVAALLKMGYLGEHFVSSNNVLWVVTTDKMWDIKEKEESKMCPAAVDVGQ